VVLRDRFQGLDYRRLAVALCVGVIGGLTFSWIGTPMPWMLGPLCACLLASLVNVPLAAPMAIRPPMTAMIGVMMGAGYSPALFGQVGSWWATILGLVVFMALAGLVCVSYFRLVARYDFATAYFAGMPGGLVEMVLLGENSGADMRKVALTHSARIVFTVMSIPFLVQWLEGAPIARMAASDISMLDMNLTDYGWLAFTLLAGLLLGRFVKLPSRYLMGPLIISVAVHISGLSTFKPPWELVLVAQVVLGTVIGCRFSGSGTLEILGILVVAFGSCVLMIGLSIVFALGVSYVTQYTLIELLLAYSPGGLAEMGLLALALNVEVALVSTHHILRILIVATGASLLMPLFGIGAGSLKAERTQA
jgi:membrane AbrB-like protein